MICNTCNLDSAGWIFLPDGSVSCSECTRSLVTALEQQVEELRNELTDGIAFAFNMMEPRVEADLKDTLDEQLQVLEASYVARRQALIQAESTAKLALAQAQIKHGLLVKAQAECERLRGGRRVDPLDKDQVARAAAYVEACQCGLDPERHARAVLWAAVGIRRVPE